MAEATARRARPYQRRRRRPIMAIVVVLALAAVATWTIVLVNAAGPPGLATCTAPPGGSIPGDSLTNDALDDVPPVPPGTVNVQVLNAGGQRSQATLVAALLSDLGFPEGAAPANDPHFPDGNMQCVGQIRFGAAGEPGASTLALVLPCLELVRDGRADDTVDVVVGTAFGDLDPTPAAEDVLDQLSVDDEDGAEAANRGTQPTVDPAVLEEARTSVC